MIRRIILFLGILFVGFFVYRRYDKPAADNFLYKIKNLSFSKTTSSVSPTSTQSKEVLLANPSDELIDKIVDTLVEKTGNILNDETISQIITEENLNQGILLP